MSRSRSRREPVDIGERIFGAALEVLQGLEALQGKPANADSYRDIVEGSIRCALLWLDGMAQFVGDIDDDQILETVRDMAVTQLADIRAEGDKIDFGMPRNRLN